MADVKPPNTIPYTVIPAEGIPPLAFQNRDRFDVEITSMRVHEIALQRWLNERFLVADGFPIPVLFSTPMSAFADFQNIWANIGNPFSYLLKAKDASGQPIYRAHPEPIRLPLITIKRNDWKYDSQRNFSVHQWRNVGWPTVSSNVTSKDRGNVYQTQMPAAWNYSVQIDHYATRPDSQAYFVNQVMRSFGRSAGTPNTWIKCVYPGFLGKRLIRIVADSESIANATEEEVPDEQIRIFRTTVNLRVEGWWESGDKIVLPALWKEVSSSKAVSPLAVEELYSIDEEEYGGPEPTDTGSTPAASINEPTNVIARQTSMGEISVSWSNQLSGYKLYVDRYDSFKGEWVQVAAGTNITSGGNGTFVDSGITNYHSQFFYQYRLKFQSGNSSSAFIYSNYVSPVSYEFFEKYEVGGGVDSLDGGFGWLDTAKVSLNYLLPIASQNFDINENATGVTSISTETLGFASDAIIRSSS